MKCSGFFSGEGISGVAAAIAMVFVASAVVRSIAGTSLNSDDSCVVAKHSAANKDIAAIHAMMRGLRRPLLIIF